MALLTVELPAIWVWLKKKFSVVSSVPGYLFLDNQGVVQITSDLNEALETQALASAANDISAAAGGKVTYWTVPAGKKWIVHYLHRLVTIGDSRIMLSDDDGASYTPYTALGTGEEYVRDRIILAPGWLIVMRTTGNGSDTNVGMDIMYSEVDALSV